MKIVAALSQILEALSSLEHLAFEGCGSAGTSGLDALTGLRSLELRRCNSPIALSNMVSLIILTSLQL